MVLELRYNAIDSCKLGIFLRDRTEETYFMKSDFVLRALLLGVCTATLSFAGAVTINNPSFETLPVGGLQGCGPGVTPCNYDVGNIPGWTLSDPSNVGLLQPLSSSLVQTDGPTVVYSNSTSGAMIAQILTALLTADTTYTLQVDVGRRVGVPLGVVPTIGLYYGGGFVSNVLSGATQLGGAATGTNPAEGGWSTYSLSFTTGSSVTAGQNLAIVIGMGNGVQTTFDNVRLDAGASVPEPGTLGIAALGLIALVGKLRRSR